LTIIITIVILVAQLIVPILFDKFQHILILFNYTYFEVHKDFVGVTGNNL